MKNFLKEITPEDKKLIKEMLPVLVAARAANDSLTDLDVFELIKPKSESLYHKTYERAWKGAQSGKDHISQLMFLKQVYDGAKQKLTRAEVLEVYKEFPIVDKIFEDKDVKSLLQGIEGKNAEEVKQFVKEHNVQFELKVPLHKT
uniref:DUF2059 domain-containing protein n=2 Tax=Steinernema glaseri TaxID=37863 RepID=A0A1I7YNN2_9BILA